MAGIMPNAPRDVKEDLSRISSISCGIKIAGMRYMHVQSVCLVAGVLVAGRAHAADATCKLLADANTKIYSIPTHMYMTETAASSGGQARNSEVVYLNGKTYVQVAGKWRVSPQTPQKMIELRKETEAEQEKTMTCKVVRDESVNGEAAVLYSAHQQDQDAKSDSQIWISKSRGVPIKLEMDMGAAGKSHRTMRYEYTNIQAPAGVQ
jgi:outer membrane lipoprotein-sorting protein